MKLYTVIAKEYGSWVKVSSLTSLDSAKIMVTLKGEETHTIVQTDNNIKSVIKALRLVNGH